ncbi:hypothetical protein EWM64_g6405 [Hericium alpestre]|uniref:HAT C-terminal dimerisation domain-containing protein n=1 Tax=Hericium alpestre TaxID=135208 RepID=A0A4Y9ZU76_9AGAM|nr:hypothetical protein EWM64_g6405 [Hericium alpestre]
MDRPRCSIQAPARVADPSNAAAPASASNREAVERTRELERAREAERNCELERARERLIPESESSCRSQLIQGSTATTATLGAEKRIVSAPGVDADDSSDIIVEIDPPRTSRKCPRIQTPPCDELDSDGLLKDIELLDTDVKSSCISNEQRCHDITEFFDPPFEKEKVADNKKIKKFRSCKICRRKKQPQILVNEATTLRRHLEAKHAGEYCTWATKNKFKSRLPGDIRERKARITETQTQLDPHLQNIPPTERVTPYSDKLFRKAAIEWLIATDQPLSALEHPAFIHMVNIAARATNGVKVPGRKVTRDEIIRLFKVQMDSLRQKFLSDAVKGRVNLTCDAYQADNVDAYFATTGHWISEEILGQWKLEKVLLGFVCINNAHHGQRLGQALFKITERLDVTAKVGFVTCDNASNNRTMLQEFGKHYTKKTAKPFDAKTRRVCKAKHFNPHDPDVHVPNTVAEVRDEIGLIRAIAVKERSSSKRKELFRRVQEREGVAHPQQLLIDMPVHWSSTYAMLNRAEKNKDHVETFVYEMGREEKNIHKHQKIDELQLSSEEWNRAAVFLDLLAYADRAQQAFSSDKNPTLHLALPALEALHKVWTTRFGKAKYADFKPALEAAIAKVSEYYDLMHNHDAFIIAMLLDPVQKAKHFKHHWSKAHHDNALNRAEQLFKERYEELYGDSACPLPVKKAKGSKIKTLLRELSSDDEDDEHVETVCGEDSASKADPAKLWLVEFRCYLETRESVADDISLVTWWGQNAHRYPVWASLTCNYLSIMAASVSSESAFSQAGITISKRRSRLKADIVEALQFLKCLLRCELFFRCAPSSIDEVGTVDVGEGQDVTEVDEVEES